MYIPSGWIVAERASSGKASWGFRLAAVTSTYMREVAAFHADFPKPEIAKLIKAFPVGAIAD